MFQNDIENSIRLSLVLSLLMLFTSTVSANDVWQDEYNFGETLRGFSLWTDDLSDKNETRGRGTDEEPALDADSCRDISISRQSSDRYGAKKSGTIFRLMADESAYPVCVRSKTVRTALLEKLNTKDCSEVTVLHLRGIKRLDIHDIFDSLKYGDFYGLTCLEDLHIMGVVDLPHGILSDLINLKTFSLSNDSIKYLSR